MEPKRHARRRTLLAPAVALAVLAGPLAACGSSGSACPVRPPRPARLPPAAPRRRTPFRSSASSSPSTPATRPGPRPPRPVCGSQSAEIEIERCYQTKTENADAQIDIAQFARYSSASPADRKTILTQDSAWLTARAPVCAAAFNTGGTIDGISAAACLLDESNARLAAVKGEHPAGSQAEGHRQHQPEPAVLVHHTRGFPHRRDKHPGRPDRRGRRRLGHRGRGQRVRGQPQAVLLPGRLVHRPRRARAVDSCLLPRPGRQEVRVRHRLLQAGKGPERQQERRRLPLRPGAPVAVWA